MHPTPDESLPQVVLDYSGLEVVHPSPHHPNYVPLDAAPPKSEHEHSNVYHYQDYQSTAEQTPISVREKAYDRRSGVCGVSRKAFWIVIAVLAVVVIGAVAGGVAGGLSSRKSGDSTTGSESNSTTPEKNTTISIGNSTLLGSQLSAVNWTDGAGRVRRAVFYQIGGALLLSHTEGEGNAWNQVNISHQFTQEEPDKLLRVKPRTPLAAAALPWQGLGFNFIATLYYMNDQNQVRELVSSSEYLSSWTHGVAWNYTFNAASDSRLAAVAYYCPSGCLNAMCIAYQDPDRVVRASCGNNWATTTGIVQAFPGSPLSLIPFAADGGKNISSVSELRLFYYTNTDIRIFFYNLENRGAWSSDPVTIIRSLATGSDGTAPQIVAAPSDFNANIQALGMDGSGSFAGSWYQKTWNLNQRISFSNENQVVTSGAPDTKTASIAMTYNHYFYSLASSGKEIMEYSWSSDSPYLYKWAARVSSISV